MISVIRAFNKIAWWIKSEQSKLEISLSLAVLKPMIHPRSLPQPTVDYGTRAFLELFRHFTIDGYLPGLSKSHHTLVQSALNGLISTEVFTGSFPMEHLHGFTASKSSMSNNRTRGSQPSMADMGKLVDDLRDLEGKTGDSIIEACKSWPELRLKQGIRLSTDSWHKRYYWSNSGGSHHMAVLCHELLRQNKSWTPTVEIREHKLNLSSLKSLEGKVTIFVVMRGENFEGIDQVFLPLPPDLRCEEVRQALGVSVPISPYLQMPFSDYQFVIIDHSRQYADIALTVLQDAITKGLALTFEDFLKGWLSAPLNDLAVPSRISNGESEKGL